MPCVRTLVFLSTRMDIAKLLVNGFDDLFSRVADRLGGGGREAGGGGDIFSFPDLSALLDVRALEPHDQRHLDAELARRVDDALCDHVAAHDAAENVNQYAFNPLVREQNFERLAHARFRRAATYV